MEAAELLLGEGNVESDMDMVLVSWRDLEDVLGEFFSLGTFRVGGEVIASYRGGGVDWESGSYILYCIESNLSSSLSISKGFLLGLWLFCLCGPFYLEVLLCFFPPLTVWVLRVYSGS